MRTTTVTRKPRERPLGRADAEPFSYRADPRVPPFPDDKPIVVFDGSRATCYVPTPDDADRFLT